MSRIPPFYVDEATKNKLADLNDVQILKDYSTFIHQSEDGDAVKDCSALNPLHVNAVLKYGVEQKEISNVSGELISKDNPPIVVCADNGTKKGGSILVLDNFTDKTRLSLQLEDGEVDDFLKIYTNYVRVEDGFGDWHYDLYFNVQNLFNSPFEYISTITGQPNVLILPDSYLRLSGDKWKKTYDDKGKWTGNEIDDGKVKSIKEGGTLTIYGQAKTYSDDVLSDVRTIRLFSYQIWNISDDKPKFLIKKTFDITKSSLTTSSEVKASIEFSDVLWTIEESQFKKDDMGRTFKELNEDIVVVQPVKVRYNYSPEDDFRIEQIQFDVVNDVIDFNNVPSLLGYSTQHQALNRDSERHPHYDRWSDRHMGFDVNPMTKVPRITLKYGDAGFNCETIYLRWLLPKGCRIMDTMDRLCGHVFSSTAANITTISESAAIPKVDVKAGHVVARVAEPGKMYLGLEHSTTARKAGYVLTGLADAIRQAIVNADRNPTLVNNAITEEEIRGKVKETN